MHSLDPKETWALPLEAEDTPLTMLWKKLVKIDDIGFDKTVADRVFFIDAEQIIEDNEPEEFFKNPQNERTQLFLSQILQH